MADLFYQMDFYEDPEGTQPVRKWLRELPSQDRRTIGAALRYILQEQGVGVCGTAFGKQLGGGIFEFRLREGDMLVRVFCHAFGDRRILLLGAYDKRMDPSGRQQSKEISESRKRLTEWRSRSTT